MLQALNTGHDGSLTTVHANSPADALRRVETLALMAGVGLPHAAVREQVASALDVVVHQARLPSGERVVESVTEVVRVAGGAGTRELYRRGGQARPPGPGTLPAGSPGCGPRMGASAGLAFAAGRGRCAAGSVDVASARGGTGAAVGAGRRRAGGRARAPGARGPRPGRRGAQAAAARRCGRRLPRRARRWPARSRAVVAGAAGPWAVARVLRARRERYRRAVDAGCAQVAVALADALGGGHSLRAAIARGGARRGRRRRGTSSGARPPSSPPGRPRTRRSARCATGPARSAWTCSWPPARSSAAPAATWRGCCATPRRRWRSRGGWRASCAPPPPRRASRARSWCCCPPAARCSPSWRARAGSRGCSGRS